MIFQVHRPAFPLNRFIDHLIYYDGFNPLHNMDRFLPDGNTEIIIDLADNPQYIYDNETLAELQTCRRAWVSGVRTRPITIPSGRGSRMLIVAFKKGRAHPFYHLPMRELIDRVVDADIIFGRRILDLRERLLESQSIDCIFYLVEKFLSQQAGPSLESDMPAECVEFALASLVRQPDMIAFQNLSSVIGYSQKHFIDMFKNLVGLQPKQYLKILRFQKAIQEIEAYKTIHWSEIALESGYYDQAHFINDFKNYSGFTPNEYMKRKTESLNYVPVG